METLRSANIEVEEIWTVICPYCEVNQQEAPFNHDQPMQPMVVKCTNCAHDFVITYERDL